MHQKQKGCKPTSKLLWPSIPLPSACSWSPEIKHAETKDQTFFYHIISSINKSALTSFHSKSIILGIAKTYKSDLRIYLNQELIKRKIVTLSEKSLGSFLLEAPIHITRRRWKIYILEFPFCIRELKAFKNQCKVSRRVLGQVTLEVLLIQLGSIINLTFILQSKCNFKAKGHCDLTVKKILFYKKFSRYVSDSRRWEGVIFPEKLKTKTDNVILMIEADNTC